MQRTVVQRTVKGSTQGRGPAEVKPVAIPAVGPRTAVVASIALLVATLLAASCSSGQTSARSTTSVAQQTKEFSGYVRTPPLNVAEVSLPDTDGQSVRMVAQPGGLRLVFFGYTTCPDVCPATLGYVKMALESLPPEDAARVGVDMVTVDPKRDTAEVLTKYVRQFVPSANAIRSDDPYLLRSAAKAFGADYSVRVNERGDIEVSHTGDLYAIDDRGTIVLAWPFGTAPADIQRDLARLVVGERPRSD